MIRNFVVAAWNRFKTEGDDLRAIRSFKEQNAFVRDIAVRREEVDAEAGNADDAWDFERMVSVYEVAAFRVRGKLNEIERLCKDVRKTVPASVIVLAELLREVFETKRENAKSVDRSREPVKELADAQLVGCLIWANTELASAFDKALKAQVRDAGAKYGKMVEETNQAEEDLRVCITPSVLLLRVEINCITHIEKIMSTNFQETEMCLRVRSRHMMT